MHPVALAPVDIPENLPRSEITLGSCSLEAQVQAGLGGGVPGDQALQETLRAQQHELSVLESGKPGQGASSQELGPS